MGGLRSDAVCDEGFFYIWKSSDPGYSSKGRPLNICVEQYDNGGVSRDNRFQEAEYLVLWRNWCKNL